MPTLGCFPQESSRSPMTGTAGFNPLVLQVIAARELAPARAGFPQESNGPKVTGPALHPARVQTFAP
jgi:hypothetical protein